MTVLTSLMLVLVVPTVLLGRPAGAGAGAAASSDQSSVAAPVRSATLVFQAVSCTEWASVPGNFTPDVPVDDTAGLYRSWGPVDPALVAPVELNAQSADCRDLNGVQFRVSASAWGTDLEAAEDLSADQFEVHHGFDSGTGAGPETVADAGAEPAADPAPVVEGDPPSPPTSDVTSTLTSTLTSAVTGVTGADGEGLLVADAAELSVAQQTALRNGSGLWVAAAGFEGSFANLRCHADRYNADNLEVIRAGQSDTALACVLYVVQTAGPAPVIVPPALSPVPLPVTDLGGVATLIPGGGSAIVTLPAPDRDGVIEATTDSGGASEPPKSASPSEQVPTEATGGGIGGEGAAASNGALPALRAVQEGLADLNDQVIDPGRLFQRDVPVGATQGAVATAPLDVAMPAPPATPTGPIRPLVPRLAGSRITAAVPSEVFAPLQAPVTQNLTVALAAGLSAVFLTGLGITIRVAGRPF
ncbi:MAG: hypothetical protein ACKV2O_11660 [Acidimicrobiales bacterium]